MQSADNDPHMPDTDREGLNTVRLSRGDDVVEVRTLATQAGWSPLPGLSHAGRTDTGDWVPLGGKLHANVVLQEHCRIVSACVW